MNNFSIIVGIKSFTLYKEEKNYLKKFKPLGVILFNRNVLNKKQVISLIKEIKDILGSDCLVMIDQEGGKVSRLRKEIWPEFPAANVFGLIAENNLKKAKKKTFENFYLIGKELKKLGITYNCAPVLDLFIKNSNAVIGNRSFSRDPKIVSLLGYEACKGLIKANIKPILKHIPGHGRSKDDSHKKLPEIGLTVAELKDDFFPFKKLNQFNYAMTAHIKYKKIDNKNCATQSKIVIKNIIRKLIGFKGVLFSDDLCMKALKGGYYFRAKKAIEAGCEIVLHCEPNLEYMIKSTLGAGKVSNKLRKKLLK
tara:strand:+ start:1866 stop:2792 length:927 start_codon:yes stop_codon:yes gene_type:complete